MSKRKGDTTTSSTTAGGSVGKANPNYQEILKHVYHPARLKVIQDLKTVQGTVVKMKAEPDGDYHVFLDNGQECEIICAAKPITQQDAIPACQGYVNKVKIPKVGDRVTVTGQYVYDTNHSQYEIHPVYDIK